MVEPEQAMKVAKPPQTTIQIFKTIKTSFSEAFGRIAILYTFLASMLEQDKIELSALDITAAEIVPIPMAATILLVM